MSSPGVSALTHLPSVRCSRAARERSRPVGTGRESGVARTRSDRATAPASHAKPHPEAKPRRAAVGNCAVVSRGAARSSPRPAVAARLDHPSVSPFHRSFRSARPNPSFDAPQTTSTPRRRRINTSAIAPTWPDSRLANPHLRDPLKGLSEISRASFGGHSAALTNIASPPTSDASTATRARRGFRPIRLRRQP